MPYERSATKRANTTRRVARKQVDEASVLFVSKPVVAPFHDGSICLVRELSRALREVRPRIMGVRGLEQGLSEPGVEVVSVYQRSSGFAPALQQNARVLFYLLTERHANLWHFVFAPNPRSSAVGRSLVRARGKKVVQTVASAPKEFDRADRLLFGNIVVAQSEWTRARLSRACRENKDIRMIRQPVASPQQPTEEAIATCRDQLRISSEHRVVVYPGDLEFSSGAHTVAASVSTLVQASPDVCVVFACRRKTERAVRVEAELRARLDPEKVRFAGELPSLLPLLAAAELIFFPVDSLYGKVDIPIALLEAMYLERPIVALGSGPINELKACALASGPDDAIRLARQVLLNSELQQRLVSEQLRQVQSDFAPSASARGYEQVYRELISREE